jgi:shikimate 5-dehydrogenase
VAHFSRTARHMELRARPWHDAIIESELGRADLLINASGIGVEEGESPIPADLMPADRYVLDLVLNRASTPLMEQARAEGGTVTNGQGAFLASTSATVKLLTGSPAAPETLRAALAAELGLPEESLAVVGD